MQVTNVHAAGIIAVAVIITILTRALPFLLLGRGGKTPDWVNYLGKVLPYAIMAMLVVYCLKGTNLASPAGWLPALIASVLVVALHVWKRNTLLSIIGGTICYMALIQVVFA